jgi:folate-binding protein YgfZ
MLTDRWQTLAAASAGTGAGAGAGAENQPSAALIDSLGVLRFSGPDVLNFLQGYLTIDLERLTEQTPLFAALTNLKGRVVATGWCQRHTAEQLDWIIHADLISLVNEFMARYLAFSKTDLVEIEPDCITVGLIDHQGLPCARLISSEAELDQLAATHQLVPSGNWVTACIEQGIAVIDGRTSEAYLPQMIGLVEAGGVDFDKGCYLGQEVVARAQHRGEVKRRLLRLRGSGGSVQSGTPLQDAEGKEAGNVLTSEPPLCLAVVRRPVAASYRVGAQLFSAD